MHEGIFRRNDEIRPGPSRITIRKVEMACFVRRYIVKGFCSTGVVCGFESWRPGSGFFVAGGGRRAAQRISDCRLSRETERGGDVPSAGLDTDVRIAVADPGFDAREVCRGGRETAGHQRGLDRKPRGMAAEGNRDDAISFVLGFLS